MEEIIRFTIPLSPYTKKNHQQIVRAKSGRLFVIPSKEYLAYEESAMWYIPKVTTIDIPCNVKCVFYMPTARRCDLTNLLEAVDDIMVKAELLKDDNYTVIQSHDGSRVYVDRQKPRTEITITKAVII